MYGAVPVCSKTLPVFEILPGELNTWRIFSYLTRSSQEYHQQTQQQQQQQQQQH